MLTLDTGDRVLIAFSETFWLDEERVEAVLLHRAIEQREYLHGHPCECWWVRYEGCDWESLRWLPIWCVHPRPLRHWEMQDRRWWMTHEGARHGG